MTRKRANKHNYINFISVIILLIGLTSAALIYITAPDEAEKVLGYDSVHGNEYSNIPSRMDVHNLELYGGKQLLLTNDFVRWFDGLWQGKTLATTIACISIITAGVIFFFNNFLSFEDESENKS